MTQKLSNIPLNINCFKWGRRHAEGRYLYNEAKAFRLKYTE
jgi:hypothetical protein